MSEQIKVEYSQHDTSLMDSMINEGSFAHRKGRDQCPYCNYGGTYDLHLYFLRLPNIVQVIWTPNRYSKLDSALIISHCPRKKCRKPSWEHIELHLLRSWAKDGDIDVDPELVTSEINRKKKEAIADWESSLCAICFNLEEVPDEWYSCWGWCSERGTAPAIKKCDHFQEIEDKLELTNFSWDRWMKVNLVEIEGEEFLRFACPKCGRTFSEKELAKQHASKVIQKTAKIQRRLCDFNYEEEQRLRSVKSERRESKRKKLLRGE